MSLSQSEMTQTLLTWHSQTLDNDFRRVGLWAWLERHIPQNARTLDAGCGTGYMLYQLAKRGTPAVGVDFEQALVEFANALMQKQNAPIPVYQAGLGEGKLAQYGTFERILCLDVIEHIQDDTHALAELHEALTPNGQILLSVPALPALYGNRDRQIGHYRRYTKRTLLEVATQANLRVIEMRYWNLLGVLPYLFYEKVLNKPINDSLRQDNHPNAFKQGIRKGLGAWLTLETRLPLPLGLSLFAVLSRQ